MKKRKSILDHPAVNIASRIGVAIFLVLVVGGMFSFVWLLLQSPKELGIPVNRGVATPIK